jgi:N-acetylglutamate synthase-like GNAT family acetyltransferase
MTMTATSQFATRRATLDDVPQLLALWRLEQLPAEALEKRFLEFQVVCNDAGEVLATVGLQIAGVQGQLHSEAVAQPEHADHFRELLWKRLQVVVQNHALERLWTRLDTPWWRERGFTRATGEELASAPQAFRDERSDWNVLKLRAASANDMLEKQFAELRTLQQQEAAKMKERVQWAKRVALGVTVIVFLLVVAWAVTMLKVGPKLFR